MNLEPNNKSLSFAEFLDAAIRDKAEAKPFPYTLEVCRCRYCSFCQNGKCALKRCCCIRQTYDPGMEYRLIQKFNSYVIGVHNYYSIATHVNIDIHKIAFDVKKSLYNRLKHRLQKGGQITNRYIKEKYGTSREVRYLNGHAIVPIKRLVRALRERVGQAKNL